jgi:mannose-1-phosphate guanylyltransferase
MKAVILAAGFGSRLWPLSTPDKPKQFQPIIDGRSPLQYTYAWLSKIVAAKDIYPLTLTGLENHVKQQLPEVLADHVICVPARRNTFPHSIYAVSIISKADDEPILFTTVDHMIQQEEAFVVSVRKVVDQYSGGLASMLLLANNSSAFDANAGYMSVDNSGRIHSFKEKPASADIDNLSAQDKRVLKDTAMFITSKKTFNDALATMPGEASDTGRALLAAPAGERDARFLAMPFVDIATGFYEKASGLGAVMTDGDYIDLGSFNSLYTVGEKDPQGNVIHGNVLVDEDSRGNYIFNQLENPLVVIHTNDSVIVQGVEGAVTAPRQSINKVGEIYKARIFPTAK